MSGHQSGQGGVSSIFKTVTNSDISDCRAESTTRPFSIRLTAAERTLLEERAGDKPLGTYMREVLLAENAKKRKVSRKPRIDDQKAAQLLARLGQSRLSSNLNQLAKSANMGTLDVSDEVEEQLRQACTAVRAMREALMIALRLRPGG